MQWELQKTMELDKSFSLFACWFQPGLISQPTVFSSHNKSAPAGLISPETNQRTGRLMVNKPVVLLLVLPSWPLGYACENAMSPCIVFQVFNLEQIVYETIYPLKGSMFIVEFIILIQCFQPWTRFFWSIHGSVTEWLH